MRGLGSLPLGFFYGLSSFVLFPLMYYVLRYRRSIVQSNLKAAYPQKNLADILRIEKSFYKYLADLFAETLKSFKISKDLLMSRISYDNIEIFDKIKAENRNVIFTLGHIGNYEWIAKAFAMQLPIRSAVAYHKMSSGLFEYLFKTSRTEFGTIMFPTEDTGKYLRTPKDELYMLTLANDQSAPPDKCYWTRFMNQDTSFFVGTEKVAKQLNLPVIFGHVSVPKRGYYHIKLELITENPQTEPEGFIMEKHANWLEKDIQASPEHWLWSHRRWKHKMPEGVGYGFTR